MARSRLLQEEQVVGQCEARVFPRGLGEATMDISALAPGKYVVKSEAVAADGKVLGNAEAELEQFAQPQWWKSQAGVDHTVPWPWTPVTRDGGTIGVLGREYRCAGGSLPRQVVARGQEMLAAPMSLKLTAGGATTDLADLPATDLQHPNDAVGRRSATTLGNLDVALQVRTEFDGLQRYDLTFTPRAAAGVEALTLEIPLKRECATFLMPSTGHTASTTALGDDPWRSRFMPQVWVGNDDLGLAWCAESDQYWRPRDDQMIEVVPEGDRTVLRCRIVRAALPVTEPITITFALVATPVKDGHGGDPFAFRFGPGQPNAPLMEFCATPAPGTCRRTAAHWSSGSPPPKPRVAPGARWPPSVAPEASLRLWYLNAAEEQMQIELKQGKEEKRAVFTGFTIPAGEFRHVALTWGERLTLYADGKRLGEMDQPLPAGLFADPAKLSLRFGCAGEWSGYTQVAVDEVRVSRGERYAGETCPVPDAPSRPTRRRCCSTIWTTTSALMARTRRRQQLSSPVRAGSWVGRRPSAAGSCPAASAPACRSPLPRRRPRPTCSSSTAPTPASSGSGWSPTTATSMAGPRRCSMRPASPTCGRPCGPP